MFRSIKNILDNRRLCNSLRGRDLVLLYHFVGTVEDRQAKFHAVTPKNFRRQILQFKEHWDFVNEEQFFAPRQESERPRILLSFDDGYRETLRNVPDFLEREKVPFIFFVNKSLLEGAIFWRDKVRLLIDLGKADDFIAVYQLSTSAERFYEDTKDPEIFNSKKLSFLLDEYCRKENILPASIPELFCSEHDLRQTQSYSMMKIGNHTTHHYCLSTLPAAEQEEEIRESQEYLLKTFGEEKISKLFSTPFGSMKSFNENTVSVVKESGYTAMLISVPGDYKNRAASLSLNIGGLSIYKRLLPKNNFTLYA